MLRLAHHSLLKLKKYEGLVHHDKHSMAEINEITDLTTNFAIQQRNVKTTY